MLNAFIWSHNVFVGFLKKTVIVGFINFYHKLNPEYNCGDNK